VHAPGGDFAFTQRPSKGCLSYSAPGAGAVMSSCRWGDRPWREPGARSPSKIKAGCIAQVLRLRGCWSSSALGVAPGAFTPVRFASGLFPCLGPWPGDAWPDHRVGEIAKACSRGSGPSAVPDFSPTAGRVLCPGPDPGGGMSTCRCGKRQARDPIAPTPGTTCPRKESKVLQGLLPN